MIKNLYRVTVIGQGLKLTQRHLQKPVFMPGPFKQVVFCAASSEEDALKTAHQHVLRDHEGEPLTDVMYSELAFVDKIAVEEGVPVAQ